MSIRPVSGQGTDDGFTRILVGSAIVLALMYITYQVSSAAERNRVRENCAGGVLTRPCIGALARTGGDVASRTAPVAAACFSSPISPGACFATIGAQILHQG